MPDLSLRNIDQIASDIRKEEITFSHLLDDLIDHVCCDVEYEMQAGFGFHDAYARVKQKMGSGRRIREIQEETLYAVDLKYRKMKKLMKISGITGTILFGFAALFKIQHWAGAGVMLTAGAFVLAFIFMPAVTGVLWKETHNRKKVLLLISGFITGFLFITGTLFKVQHWPAASVLLSTSAVFAVLLFLPSLLSNRLADTETNFKRPVYIVGTIGAVIFILGMVFKIQHWPAATLMLISGLVLIGVVAFPWYTWLTWKDDEKVSGGFIFMVTGMLLIVIPGALINLNLQNTYEHGFPVHEDMQKSMIKAKMELNEAFISLYRDSASYSRMTDLHSETGRVLDAVAVLETKMSDIQVNEPGKGASALSGYESADGTELGRTLSGYLNTLSLVVPADRYSNIKDLLQVSEYIPDEGDPGFMISQPGSLHSLGTLKLNILTAESAGLKALQ